MNSYPKKTKSQSIGSIAIKQLQKIFAEIGWESEEIEKDYGEDLMIQIFENGEKLPIKIFAQVKGTKNIEENKRNGKYVYSGIKKTTFSSWIDSNESTVLILWGINQEEGVFGFINKNSLQKNTKNKTKTVSIELQDWRKINKKNTRGFKRECLEEYLLKRQIHFEGLKSMLSNEEENKSTELEHNKQIVKAIFLYLKIIGIIKEFEESITLTNEFQELLDNRIIYALKQIENKEDVDIEDVISDEILISIVEWHQTKFEHPTNQDIIPPIAEVLLIMASGIIKQLQEKYREYESRIHKKKST